MDMMEMKATTSSSHDKSQDESSRAIVPAWNTSTLPISSGQHIISHQSSSTEEVLDNANLLQEILIKLPGKTVFRCTSVSKHWKKVITNPQIIRYLKFSRNPTGIFIRRLARDHGVVNFTHIPLAGVSRDGARHKSSTLNLDFLGNDKVLFEINHSSNGLMVCSSYDPICFFLYNPTSKKHTELPRPIQVEVISMNIAFQAPVTYKIVAVCHSHIDREYHVQVLESKQTITHWRNTKVNLPVLDAGDEVIYEYGVCISGVIYWPCYLSSGLLLFNVSEETLLWLPKVPQPDYVPSDEIAFFGECKGKLHMVKGNNSIGWDSTFDMLELKTDHSMWFIKHRIDLTSRARLAKLIIPLPIHVLALLPGEEEEDDIGDSYLIVHVLGEVISYNVKDHTMRKLCDLVLQPAEAYALRTQPWILVHSYLQTPVPPRFDVS